MTVSYSDSFTKEPHGIVLRTTLPTHAHSVCGLFELSGPTMASE